MSPSAARPESPTESRWRAPSFHARRLDWRRASMHSSRFHVQPRLRHLAPPRSPTTPRILVSRDRRHSGTSERALYAAANISAVKILTMAAISDYVQSTLRCVASSEIRTWRLRVLADRALPQADPLFVADTSSLAANLSCRVRSRAS